MNIIDKIKILFKLNNVLNKEIEEAKKMNNGKAGYKTTEFYFQLAAQAATLWGAVQGFIPPKYAAIVSIVGIAIYTIARTITKAISDVQATKATQATVTTTEPVTTITTPA